MHSPNAAIDLSRVSTTFNGSEINVFRNDVNIMSAVDEEVNDLSGVLSYHILQFNGGVCDQYIDWVCIGNFIEAEPTIAGIGDETSIIV